MKHSLHSAKAKVAHPLSWVWEPLEEDSGFVLRSMFGAKGVYLRGRIMLCCCGPGEEPWNGVLVCTDHLHHDSLRADFPELVRHPVLGKWLYLSAKEPRFEAVVVALQRRIQSMDMRIGVVPTPKARRGRKGGDQARPLRGGTADHP